MGMYVSCIMPSRPFCRQLCTVPALQTNTAPPRLPSSILFSQMLSQEKPAEHAAELPHI